jgi:hypothetical protein
MTNNQNNPPEINPDLLEKINLLKTTPVRDPASAAKSRHKFISEVEALPIADSKSSLGWLTDLLKPKNSAGTRMSTGNRKFAVSTIAAILIVVAIIFGGASATAYASQSALPGDALYSVKTSLEQTRISLANDAYNRAQLHLVFAQRRLDEITELLSQGRTNDIEFASTEFENYIQKAMQEVQIVQAADPERGAELSKLVSQALLDYASALVSVLVNTPDAVKPAVERALSASEDGAGEEVEISGVVVSISDTELDIDGKTYNITNLTEFEDTIQVGDKVKVHIIMTADGVMVVREIELSAMLDENSNMSTDDNSNVSDANENESEDENESDDNLNDNSLDSNSNDNISGDDSNENGDDSKSNLNESNNNDSDDDSSKSDSSNENSDDHSEKDKDKDSSGNDSNHNDNSDDPEHDD